MESPSHQEIEHAINNNYKKIKDTNYMLNELEKRLQYMEQKQEINKYQYQISPFQNSNLYHKNSLSSINQPQIKTNFQVTNIDPRLMNDHNQIQKNNYLYLGQNEEQRDQLRSNKNSDKKQAGQIKSISKQNSGLKQQYNQLSWDLGNTGYLSQKSNVNNQQDYSSNIQENQIQVDTKENIYSIDKNSINKSNSNQNQNNNLNYYDQIITMQSQKIDQLTKSQESMTRTLQDILEQNKELNNKYSDVLQMMQLLLQQKKDFKKKPDKQKIYNQQDQEQNSQTKITQDELTKYNQEQQINKVQDKLLKKFDNVALRELQNIDKFCQQKESEDDTKENDRENESEFSYKYAKSALSPQPIKKSKQQMHMFDQLRKDEEIVEQVHCDKCKTRFMRSYKNQFDLLTSPPKKKSKKNKQKQQDKSYND